MDDEFVAAIEDEHDGLEQSSLSVESQPKLARGWILNEVFDPERRSGRLDDIFRQMPCCRAESCTFTRRRKSMRRE
ncbi:hypothetical protein ADILRU_2313 [Leifsonia rubra CMS 76R]|nr:hypothetical protein ADILRU_2313 [Leifsonia rubra CMS 76R]